MYIYFDTNGTIKEVINDESIRRGSSDYNKIYCYLEGNPDIDDIWYLQKNPDGTLTNEVSFVDNVVKKAIPYDSHRDMKYFQDFKEYQFYVFTLSSSYLLQSGLVVATIRVAENNTLWALGELTFNVQQNVIKDDNDITQSQYDYLLITISSYRSEFNNELDWMKNLLFYYSNNVDITDTLTLTSHYLDKANGNANPDPNSKCTNYINLSTYTGFWISGHSQYSTTLICTYDENKTFLRSYGDGTSAGLTFTDYQFIPQDDEKFVRFSTYQYTQYPLKVVSLGELAPITDKKQDNYLFNKKYVACGDSFTKGDVISSDKVYPYLIAQRNNMRFVNMAHNGSYCHYGENGFTNPNNSYYYQNIPLDADFITIAYGLNETSTTIGTKDSADNTTIWGAYNEVLGWITTNIPNAKVGIISNDAWMTYDLRNALQEIASYWGVEFLDLKEYGKPFMISGKYSQDGNTNPSVVSQRTTQYCVSSQNGHPNELGHKVRSYIVENFLRGAYGVDNSYTRKETDTKLGFKADKSDTYTKTEVDTLLSKKQNTLTFDNTPTENSINPVTSGGVYNAINGAKTYTDNAINDLRWELGSHTLDVVSDTDVAFSKSVPANTIGCQINKIGGMSYKSINIWNEQWELGSISTTNGTNVISDTQIRAKNQFRITPNTTYYFKGTSTYFNAFYYDINGNFISYSAQTINNTFTTPNNVYYMRFNLLSAYGTTYLNDICINVSNSSINGNYYPYFEGIRDSAVTSVVSKGFNIWDEEWEKGYWNVNTGQAVTENNYMRCKNFIKVIPNTTYYLKNDATSIASRQNEVLYFDANQNIISYSNVGGNTTFTTPSNCAYIKFYMNLNYGATYNNDICINISGSANGTYQHYVGTLDTFTIDSNIQALDGYGWGINDTCYNYIDYERKVFVQKVGRVDLGTINWDKTSWYTYSGISNIKYVTSNTQIGTAIATNYTIRTATGMSNANTYELAIDITDVKVKTNASLDELPSGYLYYELATTIETDISEYLTTDTIDVEPNGTLTFNNTYEQAVPSDIDYLIEEVKA